MKNFKFQMKNFKFQNRGVTLIELIIVISIIGILAVSLGFSFQGWMEGYKLESQIKEFYVDLMNARARAMQRNRTHFVTLTTTQYAIYGDTNPSPDGNRTLEVASDTLILQKALSAQYPMTWSEIDNTQIAFNTRGLSEETKTICSNTKVEADYNCINISATRINMGKLTTKIPDPYGGTCDATNCVAK